MVPDYYEHIKFPMDLKTMGERLKSDYYKNKRLFIADFKRMLQNCKVSLFVRFSSLSGVLNLAVFKGHNRERFIPCISNKFLSIEVLPIIEIIIKTNKAKNKYQDEVNKIVQKINSSINKF